jgi:DNA-binding winged helix-turn-helix (wHTH) protein/tetratricopeptide (TPR) repeat protein/TolB-like protein
VGIYGSPANLRLHLNLRSESSTARYGPSGPLQLYRLVLDSDYFSKAMPDPSRNRGAVRFGPYEADFAGAELRKNGMRIKLQDRPFDILQILLERPGEVITRDEFRNRLWPADTFVDFDHSLNASINKLRQALNDDADSPRFVATVGRRGYKFIATVEDQELFRPEQADSPVNVSASDVPPSRAAEPRVRLKNWGLRALGLALAMAAILAIWAWAVGRLPESLHRRALEVAGEGTRPSATIKPRRSFAVLGLKNLSGKPDEAWLSTALSEMLATELAAGEQMRAVPGEKVAQAKIDLGLVAADGYSPETLARIRANLGSDVVVLGSYTALGQKANGRIRVDLRLQEATTGETIAEVATTGSETELFDLVSRAGVQLRGKLGVEAVSADQAAGVRAAAPSNSEAARLYAEGLAKLRVFDALAARDLLVKAVAAEPGYPLAHSALAAAWSALGYDGKAKEESTLAFKLSGNLSREDRLSVEGQYWETQKEWDKAMGVYQSLFAFFPDSLDYGLSLARAQDWAGKTKDLAMTMESLRKLPPPLGADPRIDWAEASVISASDDRSAVASADRAAKKGSALGERLLVALAQGSRCAKLLNMGQTNEAIAACQNAKQIYEAVGDRNGVGKELNNLAIVHYQQGDLSAAKKIWQEALPIFRGIGNDEGVATVLMNIADLVYLQGILREAKPGYREALSKYREIDDKDGEARALDNLGLLLVDEGNLAGAQQMFQQALAVTQPTGNRSVSAYALFGLGDILAKQAKLAAARRAYSESLAMRNEIGETATAAESRLALADLTIAEGRPADAESSARKARDEFRQENQADDELIATSLLAKSLLGQDRFADAQLVIETASTLAAKSQNRGVSLRFAITAARVSAAVGKMDQAKSSLIDALGDATKKGYVGYQLEARLAIGKIEMKADKGSKGREHLRELARIAKSKDFGLIARDALAAAGGHAID